MLNEIKDLIHFFSSLGQIWDKAVEGNIDSIIRCSLEFASVGRGLHYQATEVARCIREGLTESPAMPLDETVSIMQTVEAVLAYL